MSDAPQFAQTREPTRAWRSRIALVLQTILRYLLAAGMLPYGISKLANIQFQVRAWDYTRPLGETSGRVLTWAFLGYQPWFQLLLGVLETLPVILLCFRRTWRLGALLLFPVLANVVLMNFAMDLWDGTKQISLCLLALNLVLLAWSVPLYRTLMSALLARPNPIRKRSWRIAGYLAEIAIPLVGIALFCNYFFHLVNHTLQFDFIGDRQINRAGSWSIQRMSFAGQESQAASDRYLYFDFGGRCVYVSGQQTVQGRYQANRDRHSFEISGVPLENGAATIAGTYRVEGSRLILSGQRGHEPFQIVLGRVNWGRILPFEPASGEPAPATR
jgi:hypothetical protein